MEFDHKDGVVIVGAGLAGVTVAKDLRRMGYEGPVRLVSDEGELPYDRPPLSKQFLLDGDTAAISLHGDELNTVDFVAGKKVETIDCVRKVLRLTDGSDLTYGRLVLATGTRPRTLPRLAGSSVPVLTLRTVGDSGRIRDLLQPGARLVVIGGGPIGLELAATASKLGVEATVVEASARLMSRSSPAGLANCLVDHHRLKGIRIHLNRFVTQVQSDGFVILNDESRIEVDLIVVGIGVIANDGLASAMGIAVNDGIFVDGFGRTTAPDVFAAGDVTRQFNVFSGRVERIETWSNASGQAASLAKNLVLAHPIHQYRAVPWFWSDQGEARTQVAGDVSGSNEVMRGDFASGKGVSVHLSNGTIVGVAALNSAKDFNLFKRLIAARAKLPPEELADPTLDLKRAVQTAEKNNLMPEAAQ